MAKKENIYVFGHKNPDTDSICSAICYANLKHQIDGREYIPACAGQVNDETKFVLDYFDSDEPMFIENIMTQVRDIEIRKTSGVCRNLSIKKAWKTMQEKDVVTIPIITEAHTLEGLITVGDIAKSYMNVYDNHILADAKTPYTNIIETLSGKMLVGEPRENFETGKVLIAAANPDMMESFIEKGDMVILGNRYESQLCAIEMDADCIIVCEGASVSKTIRKMAESRDCKVISTPYDVFTVARLINQSISVSYFMKRKNLLTFDDTDYLDDVKEVMGNKRYRDFPIVDDDDKYIGMISRRNLLGAKGKKVILVDHNERNQAVDGIEYAEIQEIIDHHRIGAVETISPVFFRNQPLGCTATIIYQMYNENGIEISRKIAGLLCGAILSDTLMFRSPTCTAVDKNAAMELAKKAGIDVEDFAESMFSAGENLEEKSVEEIFFQDFKTFSAGDKNFGVGQIVAMNKGELQNLKERMVPYMEERIKKQGVDMLFFMMTNILTEVTDLICQGDGATALVQRAFEGVVEIEECMPGVIRLPGILSRKKQLVPKIITTIIEE